MNDLLQKAVDAHGGLKRWNEISSVTVAASLTGAIWFVKSQGDYLKDVVMTVNTKKEWMTTDFPGQDKRFLFTPERLVMEKRDGTLIQARDNPEKAFEGQTRDTPWDDLQVAYFQGEALWTYLNTPFLYTQDGFQTEEIASIQVNGETWRRLKVTFPDHIKSHTREQISCFGPDGLIRRHDYKDVGGIIFPTKRRIYAYEGDYQLVPEPLLVKIDISEITLN